MTRRTRHHSFSRKIVGGIVFMLTSVIGGFLSSAGLDLYDVAKIEVSVRSIPLDFPQFMFLIVGIAGLTLIISDLRSARKRRNRRKN